MNGNEGPISAHTLRGLKARGIPAPLLARFLLQLQEGELEAADLLIAMKETEHRPMLVERFPGWQERVEHWHLDDLDCASPEETLGTIELLVQALLERLP